MALYGRYWNRWPPPPEKGERCDASVGWEPDPFGQPLAKRCPAEAVETCFMSEHLFIQTYLCADHAPLGYRNPKKRRATKPVPTDEEK